MNPDGTFWAVMAVILGGCGWIVLLLHRRDARKAPRRERTHLSLADRAWFAVIRVRSRKTAEEPACEDWRRT